MKRQRSDPAGCDIATTQPQNEFLRWLLLQKHIQERFFNIGYKAFAGNTPKGQTQDHIVRIRLEALDDTHTHMLTHTIDGHTSLYGNIRTQCENNITIATDDMAKQYPHTCNIIAFNSWAGKCRDCYRALSMPSCGDWHQSQYDYLHCIYNEHTKILSMFRNLKKILFNEFECRDNPKFQLYIKQHTGRAAAKTFLLLWRRHLYNPQSSKNVPVDIARMIVDYTLHASSNDVPTTNIIKSATVTSDSDGSSRAKSKKLRTR